MLILWSRPKLKTSEYSPNKGRVAARQRWGTDRWTEHRGGCPLAKGIHRGSPWPSTTLCLMLKACCEQFKLESGASLTFPLHHLQNLLPTLLSWAPCLPIHSNPCHWTTQRLYLVWLQMPSWAWMPGCPTNLGLILVLLLSRVRQGTTSSCSFSHLQNWVTLPSCLESNKLSRVDLTQNPAFIKLSTNSPHLREEAGQIWAHKTFQGSTETSQGRFSAFTSISPWLLNLCWRNTCL